MAVPKRVRYEVLRRDNHTCRYCGASAPEVKLVVDHVVPEVLGGKGEPANLVTACEPCNSGKTSTTPDAPLVEDVSQDALRWARAAAVAVETIETELWETHQSDERFRQLWQGWTVTSTNQPVPLPDDFGTTLRSLRAAGLTDWILHHTIKTAMLAHGVRPENTFRYFCGICWNLARQVHDRARDLVEAAGEPMPVTAKQRIADMIDGILNHYNVTLESWVYDDLVLALNDSIRARS